MGDFLLHSATTLTNSESTVEQVVQVTTGPSRTSEVIDLTNGFKLPPLEPASVSQSLSSLLFSSGSRAAESLVRSPTVNMTSSTTESNANAPLAHSSSIPPSISSSPSSTLGSSLVEAVDKGLIYAPSYPNYILDNATLKGQIYQWSHSQFLLNGTSGAINWDLSHPNSLYSDAADPIASGAGQGTAPMVGTCDDVYVTENGMTYQVTVYCMYIGIFVLALLGNGVVCYIVQSSPRMRTVTNYFICNLAIGDILMSLFCVPFSFISILILGYWPFGVILCHLVNYSQAISVLVSAYTLVAISVDRYIVIMWPLRPRITKR